MNGGSNAAGSMTQLCTNGVLGPARLHHGFRDLRFVMLLLDVN